VFIIRSFLLLHMQSLVTVWCWVGCFLQPCSVVTAAFACYSKAAVATEQGWRKQPIQHHTVTRDCMCSNKTPLCPSSGASYCFLFVEKIYKMQHLEGSGTPVLYIGRTVLERLKRSELEIDH
jgi:hypothetical protein